MGDTFWRPYLPYWIVVYWKIHYIYYQVYLNKYYSENIIKYTTIIINSMKKMHVGYPIISVATPLDENF